MSQNFVFLIFFSMNHLMTLQIYLVTPRRGTAFIYLD